MFARNVQWAALLLFAFAVCTSCSQQDELAGEVAGGEEIVTTVGVSVPELFKTRTDTRSDVYTDVYGDGTRYLGTSGMPSVGNVDLTAHNLNYTVGVYVKKRKQNEGDPDEYALVSKQFHKAEDDNAYFEFRLLKGQNYHLVAYADFKGEKEDLGTISYTTALNDELSDAFFASEDFVATENVQVVLKRPFGKLRLVAHDFNAALAAGGAFTINKVTVKYLVGGGMLATNTFDALNRKFISEEPAEGETTVEGGYNKDTKGNYPVEAAPVVYTKEYTAEGKAPVDENGKEGPVAVFTMYLPANHVDESDTPESYMYPFDVAVEYENAKGGKTTIERSFTIDIPVKRNYLTTVDVEHFWTGPSGVMVTVDAAFDGEIKPEEKPVPTVKTAAELQAEIDKIFKDAPDGKYTERTIVLGADIDATDRVGFNLYNLKANGSDRSNRGVKIHLDLNGHTITTNGTQYPNWVDDEGVKHITVGGLFHVQGVNCHLYIDDTSGKEPVGGLKFEGDAEYAYPLVCCHNGGQATINRGNFESSSPSEAIYVYESEYHRLIVQSWILSSLGIKKGSTAAKPTDKKTLAKIDSNVKKWTASVTINGGWFENGYAGPIDHKDNVLINDYNAREVNWNKYKDYFSTRGYPAWTSWDKYVNQPFGFMFLNGGSFVEFDPSKGDNIVGNIPNKWIGNGHVQTETVKREIKNEDGTVQTVLKTVYTVIPQDEVHPF